MRTRIVSKIGFVYCAEVIPAKGYNNADCPIEEGAKCKRFFQYVANDFSQLNSSVIRVFRRWYPMDYKSNVEEIVNDEVEFYTHTVLRVGIAEQAWYKVGKSLSLGDTENMMFREHQDFTRGKIEKSYNWWVWRINQDFRYIGELVPPYDEYELGGVYPYTDIIERLKTGKHLFYSPK